MDILDKAIAFYGADNQMMQTCEELSELIQAIIKYRRYGEERAPNIAEEIADCEIMIEQVKRIMEFTEYDIAAWKKRKLERLERYIS